MADRALLTALDLAEGLQLGHAAAALLSLGILDGMAVPVPARDLARRHRVDAELLEGALSYLARRTDIVTRSDAGYARGGGCDREARFLLDLYVRAFGPVGAGLGDALRKPAGAGERICDAARADAFADDAGDRPLAAIVRQLGLGNVLDLGCGSAGMLIALAAADTGFRGVGVDASPHMCRNARRLVRAGDLGGRVRIVRGDAADPGAVLGARVLARTETIVARDLLNEFCRARGRAAVAFLRRLRATLPGRTLVVADYYGRLLSTDGAPDRSVLLHDFVQLASGQGVPPADRQGWSGLYRRAGCRLVHAFEQAGAARFVHLVRL